jgi:hypothetical protein
MPPTATLDDIKACRNKVEKNQISPDALLLGLKILIL